MFRLQVWFNKYWKWGVNDYVTLEAATARLNELKAAGIKARIKPASELID